MSTCPTCQGPMRPLFTGMFCPRDCDRSTARSARNEFLFLHCGIQYRVIRLTGNDPIPAEAVYGWSLSSGSEPYQNSDLPMKEVLDALAQHRKKFAHQFPGWTIDQAIREVLRGYDMLAFVPLPSG